MKIGYRNFSSFGDFASQFIEFAKYKPFHALADVTLVCATIGAIIYIWN